MNIKLLNNNSFELTVNKQSIFFSLGSKRDHELHLSQVTTFSAVLLVKYPSHNGTQVQSSTIEFLQIDEENIRVKVVNDIVRKVHVEKDGTFTVNDNPDTIYRTLEHLLAHTIGKSGVYIRDISFAAVTPYSDGSRTEYAAMGTNGVMIYGVKYERIDLRDNMFYFQSEPLLLKLDIAKNHGLRSAGDHLVETASARAYIPEKEILLLARHQIHNKDDLSQSAGAYFRRGSFISPVLKDELVFDHEKHVSFYVSEDMTHLCKDIHDRYRIMSHQVSTIYLRKPSYVQ